jgi:hypothetical protein
MANAPITEVFEVSDSGDDVEADEDDARARPVA